MRILGPWLTKDRFLLLVCLTATALGPLMMHAGISMLDGPTLPTHGWIRNWASGMLGVFGGGITMLGWVGMFVCIARRIMRFYDGLPDGRD
jgi:hypothetical protein